MINASRSWLGIGIRGVTAILFAVLVFLWPKATLSIVAVLFGCYAMVDGVLSLTEAVYRRSRAAWLFAIDGLMGIGVGLVALLVPSVAVLTFLYLIAGWAIVTGLVEIMAAARLGHEVPGAAFFAVAGVVSVVFGMSIILWPEMGIIILAVLFGMYALFFGVTLLIVSQRIRRFGPSFESFGGSIHVRRA